MAKTTKTAPAKKAAAPARSAKTTAAKKPAAAAKAIKPGPGVTLSLKQIAAGLAENHDMPKRQVEGMLGEMVQTFTKHLKGGSKIRLNGIGIFQVRQRPARMGRNPATGEQIQIKASKKIAFRPAKELKDAV